MPKVFFWVLLAPLVAQAQTLVNLSRQGRVADFSGFSATKPAAVGSSLPQTCGVGEVFLLLFGSEGGNLHACTQTNVWTAQSSLPPVMSQTGKVLATDGIGAQWVAVGGDVSGVLSNLQVGRLQGRPVSNVAPLNGQALIWNQTGTQWEARSLDTVIGNTVTVKADASVAGTSGVLRFNAGLGLTFAITDLGTEISIEPSIDSAVMQTRAAAQSGESLLCATSGGAGMTFACSLNPVLVSYTAGMQLLWRPHRDADGAPVTLDVDTLGAKAVKLADGVSDPSAADFLAGRAYALWYDGAMFRMLASSRREEVPACVSSGGAGMIFACGLNPVLQSYADGMMVLWRTDRDSDGTGVTLNINGLGAVAVKLPDGAADPAAGDVRAGHLYLLWYDGTVFRLVVSSRRSYETQTARPACDASERGRQWFVPGDAGVKDSLAVCAKDAADAYGWRVLY